jgi:RNA polymerase sigma-70 factor, ECF subfamily
MEKPLSLLERLRQPDDAQAWGRFIELYTPVLYHWARRNGLPNADAADLVQEVLTLLFHKLPELGQDSQSGVRGWLGSVSVEKWRAYRQRRQLAGPPGNPPAGAIDPDEAIVLEEEEYRRHLVQQALQLLRPEFPHPTWQAFQHHVVQGRQPEDVAAELRLAVGDVFAAKSLVLSRLRLELDGLLD